MRLGLYLDEETGLEFAQAADRNGLAAVLVPPGELGSGITLAAAIAATTQDTRIVVTVPVGQENPVTLAEEIAVLDHLSSGRIVVVADVGSLGEEEAAEDVSLMRACWTGRWVRHSGARWQVPARLHGEDVPGAIAVTPFPAQLQLPVWLTGTGAHALGRRLGLPAVALSPDDCAEAAADATQTIPAVATLVGETDSDRATLLPWVQAGASHLFVRMPDSAPIEFVQQHVARFLVPEAAMPYFPRIIAESAWPATWPENVGR